MIFSFLKPAAILACGLALMSVSPAAKAAPEQGARFGVNLAGAEFGANILPGTHGVNYIYPGGRELDYYRSRGRTLIRVPFRWERIQHTLNGPLDVDEIGRLKTLVKEAHARQMQVMLDFHNYGRCRVPGQEEYLIIGTEQVPVAAFADVWGKLATALKDEPGIYVYGLMNEPHDMGDDKRWPAAAQAAINAIRRVDKKTTIMVSGDAWSSAADWRKGVNETIHEKIRDPQNNIIFEAHCYFDKNLAGVYAKSYEEEGGSPNVGIERVRPFVEWCRDKKVRGFVGEFGVPDSDARWLVAMDRFLKYLQQNNIGATYWAGGPWWDKYPLSIEPADARDPNANKTDPVDRPQMLVLRQYPG